LNTATNSPHIQVAERRNFCLSFQIRIGDARIERALSNEVARDLARLVKAGETGLLIDSISFAATLAIRSSGVKLRRFTGQLGGRAVQLIALANPGSVKIVGASR
jgi:hypothetical protein